MYWILRAVGFLLTFVGFNLIFKPLSVLADVIPMLGNLVGMGTGLIAFLLASILSLITIAVAWFVYRPLYWITLLVVAVLLVLAILGKMRKAPEKSKEDRHLACL